MRIRSKLFFNIDPSINCIYLPIIIYDKHFVYVTVHIIQVTLSIIPGCKCPILLLTLQIVLKARRPDISYSVCNPTIFLFYNNYYFSLH